VCVVPVRVDMLCPAMVTAHWMSVDEQTDTAEGTIPSSLPLSPTVRDMTGVVRRTASERRDCRNRA
jgi:hypothetical protein